MGSFFLQLLTVVFALSIATTMFNKRVLSFPQAIGVPIVSAILSLSCNGAPACYRVIHF